MMTDPIADMLTRIRNALRNRVPRCVSPGSKLKVAPAAIMPESWTFEVV